MIRSGGSLLCLIFFVSGVSALLFETLWFREAGLMFGNGVWASALVTSSFMAGLAAGNAIAAHRGDALRRPLLAYAGLEGAIAVSGVALVWVFPALTPVLVPLFRPFLDRAELLNALRLAFAFSLLLIPATAMGATLPILTRALSAREKDFGRVLGRLYGWNTLGAVAGSLAGEMLLIESLGVRGTGITAGLLNLTAALSALALARHFPETPTSAEARHTMTSRARRLLAAAFLSGALLLALEVIWFRFLLLFVWGSSLVFALLLAVVLLGIALGGLLADVSLRFWPRAERLLPLLALAAGGAVVVTYAGLGEVLPSPLWAPLLAWPALRVCRALMLPTTVLSGLLFAMIGKDLKEELGEESRTTGALTLANTLGAALGAMAAGFLLLPRLGMEASFFVLALTYGVVAALVPRHPDRSRSGRLVLASAAATFALVLALFPFGLMRNRYVKLSLSKWATPGMKPVALREGLTETIAYLRREQMGEPLYYRLVTNGLSMSASNVGSQRYMKMFAYWPVAIRPAPASALLISFGLGSTARALTGTESLRRIDVVDISRDILEMGRMAFAGGYPLDDPRVRVHVEDGRFFLLTIGQRYDIVTGEPPPPKNAGVVNLYSREYFHLVRERLAPGGVATYWLPVYQLEAGETRAIIRAFCDAFEDCSLWTGAGLEWMLAGTNHLAGPVSEEGFTRQWRDPSTGPALRELGLETPEMLGTTFLADAEQLAEFTGSAAPLEDDHPLRLSSRFVAGVDPAYLALLDPEGARRRFERSDYVRRLLPAPLRQRILASFGAQRLIDRCMPVAPPPPGLPEIHEALGASLRTVVLWALQSSERSVEIAARAEARGLADPEVDLHLGLDALARRDFVGAARRFERARPSAVDAERLATLRVLSLALAGDRAAAENALREASEQLTPHDPAAWAWLSRTFDLPNPFVAQAGSAANDSPPGVDASPRRD